MDTKRKPAEPRFVRLTLEWCNRQRKKKNLKPLKRLPKGIIAQPTSCPCGAATGLYVGRYTAWDVDPNNPLKHQDGTRIDIPASVIQFVRAFDAGNLPQYIKEVK